MLKEFKAFIMRGNVVDLAVAVVIGTAFGAIVSSFVQDIITPLVAAIGGQPDFSSLSFTVNESKVMYGNFINAALSFLIIAATVFFGLVVPMNKLAKKSNKAANSQANTEKQCPKCLSSVPKKATKCKFCTSNLK